MGQVDSIIKELETAERAILQVSEENKRLRLELEYAKKEAAATIDILEAQRDELMGEVNLTCYERDCALSELGDANERIKKLEYGYTSGRERQKIAQLEKEVLFFAQAAFAGDDLKA